MGRINLDSGHTTASLVPLISCRCLHGSPAIDFTTRQQTATRRTGTARPPCSCWLWTGMGWSGKSVSLAFCIRVCPRDIYSHTVRNKDRWIVASFNDHKETRSTIPRLGSGSTCRASSSNTIRGIIRVYWRPVRCQARLGWHGSVPVDGHWKPSASCLRQNARPTARWWGCSGTTTPWRPRWG